MGMMALLEYFYGFFWIFLGIHPDTFDANARIVEGAFVDVTRTSRGDGLATDSENRRRKSVRGR